MNPQLIAFYLPQYHPIPENDAWWGKGFTEWSNVARARPLFKGHYQPHLPADLGFYDLRVPEVRQAQADLARENGIGGFCYWHYWFGGKRLLERPFNEVLNSGKPDFPFCLAWANESWTGVWHGAPGKVLMEQSYPGRQDYLTHFNAVLPAFRDQRYITVDGKPLFVIYKPANFPNLERFTSLWQEQALRNGLSGLFFVGVNYSSIRHQDNLDGYILDNFSILKARLSENQRSVIIRILKKITGHNYQNRINSILKKPTIFEYQALINLGLQELQPDTVEFPSIFPNWDNTPRSGWNGSVFKGSTPELFRSQLKQAVSQVRAYPVSKQIIFVKSWNEWAEGNYLEPDQQYGKAYLQVIREEIYG